jgi:DNA-binding response OmpR family regulator
MEKKKSCILVVDDEPDIVIILSEYLSDEGFAVCTAQNGEAGLEKIREHKIDLALLDVAMPKLNGIETLREIKRMSPELPVIMITAFRDAEKVAEAFRLGAFDCIFKPFDLKYLRKAIMAKLLE